MYFQMIFEEIIPEKQIRIAKDTRALVRRKIGLFSDYNYPQHIQIRSNQKLCVEQESLEL